MKETQVTELAIRAGGALPLVDVELEETRPRLAEEQLAYANLLDLGMKFGLLLLVVTFVLYVLGVVEPHIPLHELPKYWALPVKKYLAATGVHPGWGWVHMLHRGDFLNFLGIAFLSSVALACYAAIGPMFVRKKDFVYAWLAGLEVLVLALAASGVLKAGGH